MMRQEWLDILKGLGIIAVVVGHVMDWRYVYSFHMPLFFLISGYTFHARKNDFEWLGKCSCRYLIPYFSFLIFLNLYTFIFYGKRLSFYKAMYGGRELVGIYGTFWFVTVLFLALVLLNVVVKRHLNYYILILICLLLSYVFQYYDVSIRWNAQIVPMALVYMLLGYKCKTKFINLSFVARNGKIHYLTSFLVGMAFLTPFFFPQVNLNMKITDFGVPFISLIVSILICYGLMCFSKWLTYIIILKDMIAYIGKASLVIMFLHQFVKQFASDIMGTDSRNVLLVLVIFVPTFMFFLLEKSRMLRMFFLGKT